MTYNDDEVQQQLCDYLKRHTGTDLEIDLDQNLAEQLSLDSLKVFNLIMEIEDEFDISIPINLLADTNTVRELAQLISKIKSES